MTARTLPMGFAQTPPASPWGINFGGGLNSTAMIIECRSRGYRPDWILFADTGSERPETYAHVESMTKWCADWSPIVTVRWIRADGSHVPLHKQCLERAEFPSVAYGHAGCTSKWKVQPMERWRKDNCFDHGAFAVGYDADEDSRITKACLRGDQPGITAWYPLVAWGIGRFACHRICVAAGFPSVAKSSCFMCPNMKEHEWSELRDTHPDLFELALEIERSARARGESPKAGIDRLTAGYLFDERIRAEVNSKTAIPGQTFLDYVGDRCTHGGCMT
jgi:hypothetical protein